jgi:DNA-directed RNA polymerase specialized sigma24 family protein
VDPERRSRNQDRLRSDFESFVKDNHGFFLPVARRYTGVAGLPDLAAADIVQEALSVAWTVWNSKLAGADRGRQRAFVCTTMSNLAREEQRSQRRAGMPKDPIATDRDGGVADKL